MTRDASATPSVPDGPGKLRTLETDAAHNDAYATFRYRTDPPPWGLGHDCACDWETVEDGWKVHKRFFHEPRCELS